RLLLAVANFGIGPLVDTSPNQPGTTSMLDYRLLPAGDTALIVEFGDCIDRRISARVLALARGLDRAALAGVVETVPTFRSLMVHYDPLVLPTAVLAARIDDLIQSLPASEPV